ncbi:MAG TPA: hypothetical protein DEF42_11115 [Desulfosporosinus sp.]|nr:hypothetical protein [Desulfosporosinus sp.]
MKKLLGVMLSLTLITTVIAGCASTKESLNLESPSTSITTGINPISVNYASDDYYFDWKNGSYKTIGLNGSSAMVNGDGLAVEGSTVTISASGVYEITGTLTDGSIIVDVNKDTDEETVFLVLNGANINSQTSAPIYIKGAKKAVILLENGTNNTAVGGSGNQVNADGEPSAAIFSKADLTITGSGTLTVTGDYNDGITSKDDLKITDGTLIVNAKADGIVGKDSLSVKNGNITINAGKDGLRSTDETDEGKGNVVLQDGQYMITAGNDAIQGFNQVQIDNGTFDLNSGGGYPGKSISSGNNNFGFGGRPAQKTATTTEVTESTEEESKKGLKAGQGILINGGNINASSYEDSIHSNHDITLNGGILTLQSGDDGVHADNDLLINNGEITIKNSYESLEGKNITINGGKISAASTDDGLNVNNKEGVLTITGGEVVLNANGDGADSNGSINMTGGEVYVDGPSANGNGSIDYDGSFTMSGGTLIASGSSGMAQAPSTNTQPSILMYYNTTQAAGTTITLKDKDGNSVVTYTPVKDYTSVAMSSPKLVVGSIYTLYSGTTKLVEVTLSDSLTYLSESGVTTKPQNSGPGGGKRPGGAGDVPPDGKMPTGDMPPRE